MNVKIEAVMVPDPLTISPWTTAGELKRVMADNRIHSVPVVNEEHEPLGIVTASDLFACHNPGTRASELMSDKLFTVSVYSGVHVAARTMRNKRIHHLLVTHEKKLVGIVSSFDLLQLVEEHRFVLKNPPSEQTRKNRRMKAHQPHLAPSADADGEK